MNIGKAKAHARQWVFEVASRMPGFSGAYTVGSVNALADHEAHPQTSDVDIKVVLDVATPPDNPGKFGHDGVTLDVSFVPLEQLRPPESVLADYHLAAGLSTPSVIADPTGFLTELQARIVRDYSKERWVSERCEHARVAVLGWIGRIGQARLYHDQVTCWLFAAGGMAHVILVAGLQNPTIRRRYQAAQQVLGRYGYLDFHETLLGLMGCGQLTRERVEHHLAAVTDVFDYASEVIETPYRFAGDISATGRAISIDGSRELIETGHHREAVFWLIATYSRCRAVLANDASPEVCRRYQEGYDRLLEDVGIGNFADLEQGGEKIRSALPHLVEIAEGIVATNPDIAG